MVRQSGREDYDMFDCGVDKMDDPGMYVSNSARVGVAMYDESK